MQEHLATNTVCPCLLLWSYFILDLNEAKQSYQRPTWYARAQGHGRVPFWDLTGSSSREYDQAVFPATVVPTGTTNAGACCSNTVCPCLLAWVYFILDPNEAKQVYQRPIWPDCAQEHGRVPFWDLTDGSNREHGQTVFLAMVVPTGTVVPCRAPNSS